jgi:polyferredoxin
MPWVPPFGAFASFGSWSLSFPYVGEIIAFGGPFRFAWFMSAIFLFFAVALSFKVRRFWCRFCPTGISLGVLNHFTHFRWIPLLRLHKQKEKCTKCGTCKRVCPVQVTEVYERKDDVIETSMCTFCLRCLEMCPNEDCLKLEISEKTLLLASKNEVQSITESSRLKVC